MKLRYYGDAEMEEWHDRMIQLLETIHSEHGISVEIIRIDVRFDPITEFPGEVRHETAETAYDRDFKNNTELAANIDRTPTAVFRTKFHIAGHVAIVSDGVKWTSTLQGDAYGHGPGAEEQTPLDFLIDVADSPSNRFCVECVELLDGDETFCPGCGSQLS